MITRLRFLFVKYYYLLFIIVGLSQMLRMHGGWTILCYLSFIFALSAIKGIKYQLCDCLVFVFVAYSLISYPLFGDYPVDIYIASIRDQIFPISFYFFSRSNKTKNIDFFQPALNPLIFAFIVGLILFFLSPSWYIDYRLNGEYSRSVGNYFNVTRMSSFWTSSYVVGYSSLFVIIYIINKFFFEKYKIKHFGLFLSIAFISLFFAQQRISIAFAVLYLFLIICLLIKKGNIALRKFIIYTIIAVAFIGLIAIVVSKYMDKYYLDYIIGRITDYEEGIVEDRLNMFDKYISSITFLGEGLGKYSHNAMLHDLPCISDCEYIRTPNEIGIFGMGILMIIIFSSLITNYNKGRKYSFESLCVLFYILAMIGATPLEVSQQQPFMLWYCLGKLQNK